MTHKLSTCGQFIFIPLSDTQLMLGDEVRWIDGKPYVIRKKDS